ncbi:MAG: LamG-like jellyroll fold domain-containing protein [Bacteroidota bacterium]
MRTVRIACAVAIVISTTLGQQSTIGRIELMPNKPSPYLMRNWKDVARGFDSLAFDFTRTGQYLPLGGIDNTTINYPSHTSFVLHTVVGTTVPSSGEAITCLPAVIGATLAGIDKSNQQGKNWVLMCEEWFNKKNGNNLYLNHPDASTGDDWWYETMPNVFFFELASLYPGIGNFVNQTTTVADRWLSAVEGMGGGTTPWNPPNMNHRAWDFTTGTPNDNGVKEPEAAGAIAWLLYQAYVRTGEDQYRVGAELSMEYLNGLSVNPSYELQLPYGVQCAARMNAELGTTYDVAKLLSWCFDIGPLRSWGAMVGTWGGYDCSGLIGEIYDNEYAFSMNTFEHVGALVPVVRYDDRFARAIGKWVLNAANAARLFYPDFLPDGNQDSAPWAHAYDPESWIAHEAMRHTSPSNGAISPFATGDAITGGWGATNLTLYSSAHVGILGGIVDTTNVPGILRLNVLKTDYAHAAAYPTYLYFNPDLAQHQVSIDVGGSNRDLYDAVSNTFLSTNITGTTSFPIEGNSAVLLVVAPAGGTLTYDLNKTLINGVVVDFRSSQSVSNAPPRIKSLSADSSLVLKGTSLQVYCTATDLNGDFLSYSWTASSGGIMGTDAQVTWTAPDSACSVKIVCEVSDGHGGVSRDTTTVDVVLSINHPPVIRKIHAEPGKTGLGLSSSLSCVADDPDSNTLSYDWSAASGIIIGSGATVSWTSPMNAGNYYVVCRVADGHGLSVVDSVSMEVRDLSALGSGNLVASYSFNGNANDGSGNHHDGLTAGVQFVNDRFGNPSGAASFDGVTSSVRIANDSSLNFKNSISVNFWMKAGAFYTTREQYIISHGNWQNRWKVSLSPNSNRLRWTVKTTDGIKDLDSESPMVLDSLYNVTVLYSGTDMELYLNGQLDAFASLTGTILQTSIDLTMGQDLPADNNYNFNGILDDVRIFDYALSPAQISALNDFPTSVDAPRGTTKPLTFELHQNFPNPFNPSTTIVFEVPHRASVRLRVFDILGRTVATLLTGEVEGGVHSATWNARAVPTGVYFSVLESGSQMLVKPMQLIR